MAEPDDQLPAIVDASSGLAIEEEGRVVRPTVSEEQFLAYCELMGIEPTAEVSKRLRAKTPLDLLVRACRSRSRPMPQPNDAARERFNRAFGRGHPTQRNRLTGAGGSIREDTRTHG